MVQRILDIVMDDRRVTRRQIANLEDMSQERVHFILTDILGMHEVPARWFPKPLSADQKRQSEQLSRENHKLFEGGRNQVDISVDVKVTVNTEVKVTAVARGERTGQVDGQGSGIFAISKKEKSARSRHRSVTLPDDDKMPVKVCVCILSLIFGSVPVAMIVVGILDYNLCPGHTRLAIYMIVQGATSVVIPILVSCWCCCRCISAYVIIGICVIIGLFNFAWGIAGSVWLSDSPCGNTPLHTHAVGFTVPMWILFFLIDCSGCYVWCKKD